MLAAAQRFRFRRAFVWRFGEPPLPGKWDETTSRCLFWGAHGTGPSRSGGFQPPIKHNGALESAAPSIQMRSTLRL